MCGRYTIIRQTGLAQSIWNRRTVIGIHLKCLLKTYADAPSPALESGESTIHKWEDTAPVTSRSDTLPLRFLERASRRSTPEADRRKLPRPERCDGTIPRKKLKRSSSSSLTNPPASGVVVGSESLVVLKRRRRSSLLVLLGAATAPHLKPSQTPTGVSCR